MMAGADLALSASGASAFLTGLLFGLALAMPVGPIGLLCIRRSLDDGFTVGFATGLGPRWPMPGTVRSLRSD